MNRARARDGVAGGEGEAMNDSWLCPHCGTDHVIGITVGGEKQITSCGDMKRIQPITMIPTPGVTGDELDQLAWMVGVERTRGTGADLYGWIGEYKDTEIVETDAALQLRVCDRVLGRSG